MPLRRHCKTTLFWGIAVGAGLARLPRAAAQEPEVVVRGSMLPRGHADPTVASSSLSGEELRRPGASAADLLKK